MPWYVKFGMAHFETRNYKNLSFLRIYRKVTDANFMVEMVTFWSLRLENDQLVPLANEFY